MSQPDYHPLSIQQIEELLKETVQHKNTGNYRGLTKVQIRLDQGIKGMEDDPRPIDCPVSQKMNDLDKLFWDFVDDVAHIDIPTLARELHRIMED